jgi:pimeloyl-ACP methyl ester carboxylesterase
MTTRPAFEDITFTARDGLRLYGRRYPARRPGSGSRRPALCLPGLTRNSRDFHDLAVHLSGTATARDVYTLDYRGRGRSEFDSDWRNYAIPIEMLDVLDFLVVIGHHDVAVVGTSRGGLISLVMAGAQPAAIGAVVLNDIGPVIEQTGLARIASYVGRTPLPKTWPEAAKLVRDLFSRQFPAVPESDWETIARQLFNETAGRPAPGYDAKLSRSLSVLDGPIPALWPQFEALKRVPLLVVRGETSDLLSQQTVTEMLRRHPRASAVSVPGEGHAPLLRDLPTQDAIDRFLAAADAKADGMERAAS